MNRRGDLLLLLSAVAMALLLVSCLMGVLAEDGGQPYVFTSLRREEVKVYAGQGLYRNDNVYKAVECRDPALAAAGVGPCSRQRVGLRRGADFRRPVHRPSDTLSLA